MPADPDDFSKPGRGSRSGTWKSSGFSPHHRRYWSYLNLLVENGCDLSHQGGTFLRRLATDHTSLRIAWDIQVNRIAQDDHLSFLSSLLLLSPLYLPA